MRRKWGSDRIHATQRAFVETALRFHRLQNFTIIKVAAHPRPPGSPEA
jgi:hypothetical protein